jgi:hypothetical protein
MSKRKRQRKGSYLFQRPDSPNWWIKLQWPSYIKKSLGTSDRQLADVLAAPMIAEHKSRRFASRKRIEPAWQHEYVPDRLHDGPDGSRIMATQRELLHLDTEGNVTRRAPNGGPGYQIAGLERRLGVTVPVPMDVTGKRPILVLKNPDDKNSDDTLFETYLQHANVTGFYEREARAVWTLYKQLTDNKPLKDATRDDGRKVAAHFEGKGNKSATVKKKVGWLTAAVNLAISEGRLTFNPFSSVVPKRDDKQARSMTLTSRTSSATSTVSTKATNCWSACWRPRGCGSVRHTRVALPSPP